MHENDNIPDAEERKTISGRLYEQVRRDILMAVLRPGEWLRLNAICSRYEIGLTPAREALTQLAAEGLLTRVEQRGFVVASIDRDEFIELTRTRCMLEGMAVRESIRHGGVDWEERVLVLQHRLVRYASNSMADGEAQDIWERIHREFHDALISACGSRWILQYCTQLREMSYRYRYAASFARTEQRLDEHRQVSQACLERSPSRAAALLSQHYWRTSLITMTAFGMPCPTEEEAGMNLEELLSELGSMPERGQETPLAHGS